MNLVWGGLLIVWGIGVVAWVAYKVGKRQMSDAGELIRHQLSPQDERLPRVIEQTNALLWEATVREEGGELKWEIRLLNSPLGRELFPNAFSGERLALWRHFEVPEFDEMNARSRHAIENGQDGYTQEFRLMLESGVRWISESVSIKSQEPGVWWLVGLASDNTQQHLETESHARSERILGEMFEMADCLMWRAHVELEGNELHWGKMEIPESKLKSKLFEGKLRNGGGGPQLWGGGD